MARIIYSALVDSIRGSIGGTTFQKNAYGYTAKSKPNMIRPQSPFQNIRKNSFRHVIKSWQGLSVAQRADWNAWAAAFPQYAKHNPSAQLSGFAVFCKYHLITNLFSDGVLTNPSYTAPAEDVILVNFDTDGSNMTWNVLSDTDNEDWNLVMFMSSAISESQNYFSSRTRYMAHLLNIDGGIDFTDNYVEAFGRVGQVGDRVAFDYIQLGESFPIVQARIRNYTILS